jgi:hypothetical protein
MYVSYIVTGERTKEEKENINDHNSLKLLTLFFVNLQQSIAVLLGSGY